MIEENYDRSVKQVEICDVVDLVDIGDGVVVVMDLFGGLLFNLLLMVCYVCNCLIFYGVNLLMLVKLVKLCKLFVVDVVLLVKDVGWKYINSYDVFFVDIIFVLSCVVL